MARKAWIAIALVVWLSVLAFHGVSVSALPNHVVAGGVLGPGGDVSSGPGNAANAAGMVFYSTSQPSYTVLVGADSYTPATGTVPALFGKDVGATWNWADGDVMVAVIETVRGVNGWNAVNSTSSIDAILRVGATVQDVGNGTLETFPTITASGSTNYVFTQWPRLADANGNIVSYSLYRTPGPASPIATVPTAASMNYNDTGLAGGSYCYTVQVNYRRDLTGGVYGTTGRSERACRTISGGAGNTPPTAAITAPVTGACGTGGQGLTIRWTMSDAETAVGSLRVWLNYTMGTTPNPIAGVQDRTGFSSPASYSWTTPMLDSNVGIVLTVMDTLGLKATSTVAAVKIDSTAPTIVSTQPAGSATGVATNAAVVITFREAMNTTATEAAISFSPTVTGLTFAWSSGDTVVTVGHAAFAANTPYTLTVATGAKDACSPGLGLATAYTATFTTGASSTGGTGPGGIDPLWIIIAIIIVVVVIVALLVMRRRKPSAAPPAQARSEPDAPMEESSPPEESLAPSAGR
ncbi:MAG: hypothetical protein E6K16_01830 [Methanobacteriota archaeon]|nr:MAG: hypothetical protein E6K16_01830 [Euryarchaeota archaeon]